MIASVECNQDPGFGLLRCTYNFAIVVLNLAAVTSIVVARAAGLRNLGVKCGAELRGLVGTQRNGKSKMIDRERTKENFLAFMGDINASKEHVARRWMAFDDKPFPWIWCLVAFLLSLTVVGIPPALVLLYWGFKPPRSQRERYLANTTNLVAIETHVVVANSRVSDPSEVGAALTVGSFETPTLELEEACRSVALKLQDMFGVGPEDESEESLYELIANEDAELYRRRPIPAEHSSGHQLYALDVFVDRSVLDYQRDPKTVVILGPPGNSGGAEPIPLSCVVRV